MILSRKSYMTYILSALFISLVAIAEPNTPAPGSATFVPEILPIKGGARVTAKFHHKELGSKVSLSLMGVVVDDKGTQHLIELKQIDDQFVHSNTQYRTERSIDINYADLNAELKKKAPNANLKIGEGSELFLFGRWMNVPGQTDMYDEQTWVTGSKVGNAAGWNHYYGGPDRNGKFTLPAALDAVSATDAKLPSNGGKTGFTRGGVTNALDVGNSIDQRLANKYPGLKVGGIIGSRFENELKLHVDLNDLPRVEKFLADLAADPAKVEATFGPGWTMHENRKYVGQPMVDVYLDNKNYDGASIGMALRQRTGSGITSINYKPDDGKYMGKAVTARIEYQIEGVTHIRDITLFIDSDDAMNPVQLIREKLKGIVPSDFTIESVNLTDERLKYELKAPTGDEVEFSLDHVKSRRLDKDGKMVGPMAEFGQLEVEVNHLGAKGSSNVANTVSGYLDSWKTIHGAPLDKFLSSLGSGANMDGKVPPRFHGELDFADNSPIKTVNEANFKLAQGVFDKVTSGLFGNNWNSSGQKYAVSAAALDLVGPDRYAPSVQQMIRERLKKDDPSHTEMRNCLQSMVKITQM